MKKKRLPRLLHQFLQRSANPSSYLASDWLKYSCFNGSVKCTVAEKKKIPQNPMVRASSKQRLLWHSDQERGPRRHVLRTFNYGTGPTSPFSCFEQKRDLPCSE
eukprot:scaffold3670_cov124-Cylindrotheca_fusiformis.AAC.12